MNNKNPTKITISPKDLVRICRTVDTEADLIMLIKLGRLLNAMMFAYRAFDDHKVNKSAVNQRQVRRAFFVLAGYLWEGIQLVKSDSFSNAYSSEESFFCKLRQASDVTDFCTALKKARNIAAFHMDHKDESTKAGLKTLISSQSHKSFYTILSADSSNSLDYYYEIADLIDLNFLFGKNENNQKSSEMKDQKQERAFYESVADFSSKFIAAADESINFLAEKLGCLKNTNDEE